jgi:hypothetical protein
MENIWPQSFHTWPAIWQNQDAHAANDGGECWKSMLGVNFDVDFGVNSFYAAVS